MSDRISVNATLSVCCQLLFALMCFSLCAPQLSAQSKSSSSAEARGTKSKKEKESTSNAVAEYRSKNFAVLTDLPPADAKELLKRLETMLGHIEKYYEQKLRTPIGMFVVKDLANWPQSMIGQLDSDGLRAIREQAGVTLGRSQFSVATGQILDSAATVYAVADRGTPQHEAVHAYCQLTFGRVGPIWYAEGMAEIGQYWTEKGQGVHCHEIVLDYLQKSPPKDLIEIVDTSERSGDSWQNYAWRWVLCHMLANNPNYAPRFKPLGLGMLKGQDINFESVYGSMAKEIQFEYTFFLKHIDQGYRADLCAWDWKAKYTPLKSAAPITVKIDAPRGWQPTKAVVDSDEEYDFSIQGLWKTSADGDQVDADGGSDGAGKVVGVIFDDYRLSEPFELGTFGTFKPPLTGNLLVRCQDKWGELGDNSGKMQLKLKPAGKGTPLTKPENKPAPSTSTKLSKPKSTLKSGADDAGK